MTNKEKFLQVFEFANIMNVSSATVLRAIRKGRINAFRVGPGKRSPYRIPYTEIERIQLMSHEEIMNNLKE